MPGLANVSPFSYTLGRVTPRWIAEERRSNQPIGYDPNLGGIMSAIRISETSILSVSMCGDTKNNKLCYGVLEYNPIEKVTERITYCYMNTVNSKISHDLGELYNDVVITKVVKDIMKIHASYIEAMNTVPKSAYIEDGELNRLRDGRSWSEIKYPVK